MLKALELVGFKSFADKTRFEFPRGITAIVGPNGSGKSNVVDGIKWVLGEQSVKSLRGKEMTDCIFNGSASRPAVNVAETTLVFDNSRRLLAVDAPEVSITRRVYRSGEGEYLINQQPSRLRDIRDLFTGTGVATEAYSVIEQGKVDVMLQSSPRERRIIFEEAAGISRFKTKKIESLRRLERVEQNLLRLADIVGEVESHLKSVRQQASKARRYQEHANRLQELRIQVALADWRSLSECLATAEAELVSLTLARDARQAETDACEAEARRIDAEFSRTEHALGSLQSRAAQHREQIAALEATIAHHRARAAELEQERGRLRTQLASLGTRTGDLSQQMQETAEATSAAEEAYRQLEQHLADHEAELARLAEQLDAYRAEDDRCRAESLERLREAAAAESEVSLLEARIANLRNERKRHDQRAAETATAQQAVERDLQALGRQRTELAQAIDLRQRELSQATARLVALRQELTGHVADLNQLEQRASGLGERVAVLDELEQRFEGLGAGVQEVLVAARQGTGALKSVRGLVADLLRVPMDIAPLVDIALGERAQHVVIGSNDELLTLLESKQHRFQGRVGFVPLDARPLASIDEADLAGEPGVVTRADRAIECESELREVCRRLLGHTWIVETLADARRLAAGAGRGLTFITRTGEQLLHDGTLCVGPREASLGLISRRSELRDLRTTLADVTAGIDATRNLCQVLEMRIAAEDSAVQTLTTLRAQATAAAGENRVQITALELRAAGLVEQRAGIERELTETDRQLAATAAEQERLQALHAQAHQLAGDAQAAATLAGQRLAEHLELRLTRERAAAAARMELAKSDERLRNLRARRAQVELDRQERQRMLADLRAQLAGTCERQLASDRAVLQAESQLALLCLDKERGGREMAQIAEARLASNRQRGALSSRMQELRAESQRLEGLRHAQDLSANEIRLQRKTLADRLREDYQIELAEREAHPSDEELHQREAVEHEIAELRRRLNQLGNVNLDSLRELEELETRYASLKAQHDDLSKAKQLLVEIIEKINVDSRRLFSETLEKVRLNFQVLFRKLFGGGQADIVLEQDVDILDSGIEIVARPPGKEPRNISLLSGGEKTLTCVALLLAIFQYRPSPFCVLDEVDAALDEANIERFAAVLQEFLVWTQFIVVTHSKKTMTCATTLYGVTMQESGVSKRVAVRFEDVSDDGHIRSALDGDAAGDADETQAA
ncbi:MAG TPA: chromosome segregation protein SMC [Pirellulales bacterium]|jgi:chromosome segregation protein|nr:chromosome segregation protein SMC [Pirellulales bacterium]